MQVVVSLPTLITISGTTICDKKGKIYRVVILTSPFAYRVNDSLCELVNLWWRYSFLKGPTLTKPLHFMYIISNPFPLYINVYFSYF